MPHRNSYHKDRRTELKRWFREEYLPSQKCSRCPESHPACIDFHHVDPSTKKDAIGRLVQEARSKNAVLRELAKCIPLCANCHRKEHAKNK